MRRELGFGSLDLSGPWEDHSTYHWVGELTPPQVRGLVGSGVRLEAPRLTVTLTAGRLEHGADLAKLVEGQALGLGETFLGFKVLTTEAWPHPRHDVVPHLDFIFEPAPGFMVRQRQCYFGWPQAPRFSCLALAVAAQAFAASEPTLRAIYDSFALPGG